MNRLFNESFDENVNLFLSCSLAQSVLSKDV